MSEVYVWWNRGKAMSSSQFKKRLKKLLASYQKWDQIKQMSQQQHQKDAQEADSELEAGFQDLSL